MNRIASRLLPALLALPVVAPTAPVSAQFTYEPAGELVPGSGSGLADTMAYVPDMRFPIESGPAYANSQVHAAGGSNPPAGAGTSQCSADNYSFPWRDNYCETRGSGNWSTPMCPDQRGGHHYGQDIRPATCESGVHWAVAATAGRVRVGSYSVRITDSMGRVFEYLHMSDVQVQTGDEVQCGDRIGKVSNVFGGTPTTIHLHFATQLAVEGYGMTWAPPYMSLVNAYQRMSSSACFEPPPICPEDELAAGATCTAVDGREACIGSVAVTDEGCPAGDDRTLQGRTCNCVADDAGGARWDCPDSSTCRAIDICEACADAVSDGGSGSGGSGSGSGSGGSGSGGSGSGGWGSGGSGPGGAGFAATCRAAPYGGTDAPAALLFLGAVALLIRRRRPLNAARRFR